MIEAEGLAKAFGRTLAVRDAAFAVQPGEIVGFLGPNGAGKSTTMRILAGVLLPDAGRVRIAGLDIVRERRAAQARLGYMPEAASGFAGLTVREVLAWCAAARGARPARRREMIEAVARETALGPALDRPMRTLSKGWRQRAWFAQAVMHRPEVLILDEPTDGLDPGQKAHVRGHIRELAREAAVLLSTHVLEEAEALCDRVVVIAGGRIVADRPVGDLADPQGRLAPAFARLTAAPAAPVTAA